MIKMLRSLYRIFTTKRYITPELIRKPETHILQKIPKSKRAYISAVGRSTVTISGPPATLRKLFDSTTIGKGRQPLSVAAPYHAPHLHKGVDAQRILGSRNPRTKAVLDRYSPSLPLMSTSTGKWFSDKMTTTQILTEIINDILNEPLRFYQVLNGCSELINHEEIAKCRIVTCGPSTAEAAFITALRADTSAEIKLHEEDPERASPLRLNQAPRTSKKQKLAIVGMAGRFPDAADHEKFWDLLHAGLDVHREVSVIALLPVLSLKFFRFQKTGSTSRSITIHTARCEIPVIPLTDVSSTNLACLIPDFSTCPHEKRRRQIPCTG